jgi:hypothetical protein
VLQIILHSHCQGSLVVTITKRSLSLKNSRFAKTDEQKTQRVIAVYTSMKSDVLTVVMEGMIVNSSAEHKSSTFENNLNEFVVLNLTVHHTAGHLQELIGFFFG